MTFPDNVILEVWKRAGARCECRRKEHNHLGVRCNRILIWKERGREGPKAWEAHHKTAGGLDTPSNCEILCWECHKKTETFGR